MKWFIGEQTSLSPLEQVERSRCTWRWPETREGSKPSRPTCMSRSQNDPRDRRLSHTMHPARRGGTARERLRALDRPQPPEVSRQFHASPSLDGLFLLMSTTLELDCHHGTALMRLTI